MRSKRRKFLILTDSLSCLLSLDRFYSTDPRITKIQDGAHRALCQGKEISFLWIPSHVGIHGNEEADRLAKAALRLEYSGRGGLPHTDVRNSISTYVRAEWRASWARETENKLKEIKPELGPRRLSGLPRRKEVVLTRLRIGHTRLTHSHLVCTEDAPRCAECNCPLTVRHVLVECPSLTPARSKYFTCGDLKELFSSGRTSPDSILSYLFHIGLLSRIWPVSDLDGDQLWKSDFSDINIDWHNIFLEIGASHIESAILALSVLGLAGTPPVTRKEILYAACSAWTKFLNIFTKLYSLFSIPVQNFLTHDLCKCEWLPLRKWNTCMWRALIWPPCVESALKQTINKNFWYWLIILFTFPWQVL